MTDYSKETSFWNLLKESNIIIPIIQRDYAQGRIGKEYLRERFLSQLFNSIKNGSPLVLDFVYGSHEDNILYPLDGQQRLTTLWLLHWYLSICTGSLESDSIILSRFSYTTRVSSRAFCEKLCSIKHKYDRTVGIVNFIRDQHWFYSSYEQDPTIQSMLCMLGGTSKADKEGNDIIDGIEEIFADIPNDILDIYLNNLKSINAPIKFYLLNMEDKNLPLSDDLYIKMNARGKVLTDFENFKVDLLNYKPDGKNLLIDEDGTDENSFSHLFDTRWMDIFWHNHSDDYKVDDIFFKFINRFMLNWFMANEISGARPEVVTQQEFYKMLTEKSDDNYLNIGLYKPVLCKDCIESFYKCMNNLYTLYELLDDKQDRNAVSDKVNQLFIPYWHCYEQNTKDPFYFVPRYKEDGKISSITLQQRVLMHSICVYLRLCDKPDINSLNEWMRFVWNMIENSYIDKDQAVSAIRFFDNVLMTLNSGFTESVVCNIRKYLSSVDDKMLPKEIFGRRQLKEEIAKAKKCINEDDWIKKINEAENSLFFKGAISFLFNDVNGDPVDWGNFDVKLKLSRTIFDKNGLKTEYIIDTLYCLYSYCDNWDNQLYWSHKIFNGTSSTWKDNILLYVDRNYQYVYAAPVHHILVGDTPQDLNVIKDPRIKKLANRSLISYFIDKNQNKRDMYIRWPWDVLYFCGDKNGVMLSNTTRDKILAELLKDDRFSLVQNSCRIPNTDMLWGFDIDFVFKIDNGISYNLRWYRDNNLIYVMDEEWNYKNRKIIKTEYTGDRQKYFCFNMEDHNNVVEHFICKLKDELEQI